MRRYEEHEAYEDVAGEIEKDPDEDIGEETEPGQDFPEVPNRDVGLGHTTDTDAPPNTTGHTSDVPEPPD